MEVMVQWKTYYKKLIKKMNSRDFEVKLYSKLTEFYKRKVN